MGKQFTARDVLTYLYAESLWEEDEDGEFDENGRMHDHTTHHITITNYTLQELMDMAGIQHATWSETPLQVLARAAEEDANETMTAPAAAEEPNPS